jgi:large subunit ribosomal protein L25
MAEKLKVQLRESLGKRNTRRLRKAGRIPGILYGHGKKNVCLEVPAEELDALVHHGHRLVTLTGAARGSAFIRDLQWDVWGTHVLHVDFTRIKADEKVEVDVSIELRGEAPGIKEGGVVEQLLHGLSIECPASAIPEKLEVNINSLNLDDSITAAELELPDKAQVIGDAEQVVVHCVVPVEAPAEEAAEEVSAEPEVIGEDKEKEEEGEES